MTTHYSYFESGLKVELDQHGDYTHVVDNSDCNAPPELYILHIGPTCYCGPIITIDTDVNPF